MKAWIYSGILFNVQYTAWHVVKTQIFIDHIGITTVFLTSCLFITKVQNVVSIIWDLKMFCEL